VKALLRDGLFIITLNTLGLEKIIVFFHGWGESEAMLIQRSRVIKFLFSQTFGKAKLILVLASSFKNSLINMGVEADKVRVMTTMFDGSIFEGVSRDKRREKTLIFLSRFIREKGVYELLEAFALIAKEFPESVLILAGDGPERVGIKRWIERHGMAGRVRLPGYVRGKRKAQLLMNGSIFVFPTYGEGCPVSLLEAMAAGLPVITTPVGGIRDIFVNNENGILLDTVSPERIAMAIETLYNDAILMNKIEVNNRSKAWKNYEANIVTQKIEAIYNEIAIY